MNIRKLSVRTICAVLLILVIGGAFVTQPAPASAASTSFVTRSGTRLLLDGQVFRFSGANVYWLGLDDNVGGTAYPTHFRIDDALTSAQDMGATVIRAHTLGISVGCALCIEPSRGVFNDVAFETIDYAIASAARTNVRLIIPFTDQWHYYHGGKHVFTGWAGYPNIDPTATAATSQEQKEQEAHFYTDLKVRADFFAYIDHILNHRNQYTGLLLKDDPTIMAWETGNELWDASAEWTEAVAAHIKSVDTHHLVADGSAASGLHVNLHQLQQPSVDIYGGHFYPLDLNWLLFDAALTQAQNKVYYIGEYDWTHHQATNDFDFVNFLHTVEVSGVGVSGDVLWALLPHADTGGYVEHNDGYALHYPGDTPTLQARIQMLRNHSYIMRGLSVPQPAAPGAPVIMAVDGGQKQVHWRGVAGAATYSIERSTQGVNGPWSVVCDQCAGVAASTWTDTASVSGAVSYRVRGYTRGGVAGAYSAAYSVGQVIAAPSAPAPQSAAPSASAPQTQGDLRVMTTTGAITDAEVPTNQANLKLATTAPLTSLTVTITIQKRSGQNYQSFAGQTTTAPQPAMALKTIDYSDRIEYVYSLQPGQTLQPATDLVFSATFSGGQHLFAGDTWQVAAPGTNLSGTFSS